MSPPQRTVAMFGALVVLVLGAVGYFQLHQHQLLSVSGGRFLSCRGLQGGQCPERRTCGQFSRLPERLIVYRTRAYGPQSPNFLAALVVSCMGACHGSFLHVAQPMVLETRGAMVCVLSAVQLMQVCGTLC